MPGYDPGGDPGLPARADIVISSTASPCPSSARAWWSGRSRRVASSPCSWWISPCPATSKPRWTAFRCLSLRWTICRASSSRTGDPQAGGRRGGTHRAGRARRVHGLVSQPALGGSHPRLSPSVTAGRRRRVAAALLALQQGEKCRAGAPEAMAHRLTNKLIHAPTQGPAPGRRPGDSHKLAQLRQVLGLSQES